MSEADRARMLAVIDQTLAGEAVAPEDADLAELTLILAGQRPVAPASFSIALDRRVARRFAAPPRGAAGLADPTAPEPSRRPGRSRRRWLVAPGGAFAAAVIAAAVIVVGQGSGLWRAATVVHGSAGTSRASAVAGSSTSSSATVPAASGAASGQALTPDSAPPGRQVIRGAQLSLSTRAARIEDVARQVFAVIGAEQGVVASSSVNASGSTGGYAQFALTVPSASLGATLTALSTLHGAQVLSRADVTQDVTGRVGGAGQQLADARAQRAALLRRLALAVSAGAIDSLRIQLRDANASIAADLVTLRGLHRQVAESQIQLSITGTSAPGHHRSSTGGAFTIGGAVHDAGRVLVVAAGVTLIALAVLLPLGLLAALAGWGAQVVRRRRREQALDLV